MLGRKNIAMVVAEFFGTFILASTVLSMTGRTTFPYFSAVIAGTTYGLMVLVIGAVSGAYINPAITISMWTIRQIKTSRALLYIAAQMFGGFVAWSVNEYLLNAPIKNIAGDKFMWRVLIAEGIGAFIFALGVASAIGQNYKGLKRAATCGASLTLGVLVASFAGNGTLNPAVALGIQSWSFAYIAGPILGAVVGMNVYALLFADEVPKWVRLSNSKNRTTTRSVKKSLPAKKKAKTR